MKNYSNYALKQFNFKGLNGENISCDCYSYNNRSGFVEAVDVFKNGAYIESAKIQYYNRSWQSFEYESVLYKVINKIYNLKADRNCLQFIEKQIKAIARREAEACQKWLKDFERAYNKLDEKTKEAIAKSEITVENVKQADAVKSVIECLALLQ